MRYIIRNLRGLWKQERLIFGVMLLCILASSLILNFSYGLYQNYNVIRDETQLELKEINISVQEDKTLTKRQFEDYLMALAKEVRKAPALIFCDARFGSIADHVKDEAKIDAFRAGCMEAAITGQEAVQYDFQNRHTGNTQVGNIITVQVDYEQDGSGSRRICAGCRWQAHAKRDTHADIKQL